MNVINSSGNLFFNDDCIKVLKGLSEKSVDLIFADTDGNGYITAEDRTNLGSITPKFIGGMALNFAWKGFDLSIDLQGNFGNKIYNAKSY